jgi:L-aminopeptidase/D-esterase-like protein
MNNTLTAIPGIRIGHMQNDEAATGCTVILCPPNTVGGVDQRGGAPATRETDLLRPMHIVQHVNAILLTGGSVFGLSAADGVVRYLSEKGIGFSTLDQVVPIVPAAALYDLNIGTSGIYPDSAMGYAACLAASDGPVHNGAIGMGAGAKVGNMMGVHYATRTGIGSAAIDLGNGLLVAALVAVNVVGDIVNERGEIIAGLRAAPNSQEFVGTLNMLKMMGGASIPGGTNTIIGIIATNAKLDKDETNKLAQMAHDGIAQAVRPAHTMHDGDTLFALATGDIQADPFLVSAFAAEVVAEAIRNAVSKSR